MNMLILRRKNGELPWMDIYQKKGEKRANKLWSNEGRGQRLR